jgi:branched-subunit amino acid aminotransferase/4-amino-4-deoxychorismate lyase
MLYYLFNKKKIECFEGMKAYKNARSEVDKSIYLFRPELNAKRLIRSAKRLYLPVPFIN